MDHVREAQCHIQRACPVCDADVQQVALRSTPTRSKQDAQCSESQVKAHHVTGHVKLTTQWRMRYQLRSKPTHFVWPV